MDCVFCDPEVTELAFLESRHFRCIYNKSPILPGHSMVISKEHRQSLFDFNDAQRNELMQLGTHTAELVIDLFDADSFNWTIQDRPPAGQTVPHFHLHIIPRIEGDLENPSDWYPQLEKYYEQTNTGSEERPSLTDNDLRQITRHIKDHITQNFSTEGKAFEIA